MLNTEQDLKDLRFQINLFHSLIITMGKDISDLKKALQEHRNNFNAHKEIGE